MKIEIAPKNILMFFLSILITLYIVVSLFPPFEWGKEKLKTLSERRSNSIKDELPIKSYDLIFNSNKKQFAIGEYSFEAKYYPEHYHRLNIILSDAISFSYKSGIDTFKSYYRIAYKQQATTPTPEKKTKGRVSKKLIDLTYLFESLDADQRRREIEEAENYNEIKNEFEKNPKEWTTRIESQKDSVKNYRLYKIKKPNYYLLSREVITSELVINYLLSMFLSIAISLIVLQIQRKYLIK